MTRITNADQVVIILRNQLQRMQSTPKKQKTDSKKTRDTEGENPLDRLKSLAESEQFSDAEMHRALVQSILTHEFGTEISNDPKFQSIISQISQLLGSDDDTKQLMQSALSELKNG